MPVHSKYDLIVVGTGFSSAFFLHKYLALQSGTPKVLVLERGYHHDLKWKIANSPLMKPYGVVSALDYRDTFINRNRWKDWVYNPAFGGGSNCWWACTPRFVPDDFRMRSLYGVGRDWPLDYDELEPYYTEAEELMSISGPSDHIAPRRGPFPQPPHKLNNVDLLLKRAFPNQYFSQPTARARVATKTRPRCCASGVCFLCPVNAKFTIENDFADLFKAPGVEVELGAEVHSLSINDQIIGGVHYTKNGEEHTVSSEVVALGANAIFNAAILLNSGLTHPALGANLCEQTSKIVRVELRGVKNFNGSTAITGNGYMLYSGEHRKVRGGALIESSNIPTFRAKKGRSTEVAVFKVLIEDIPQASNKVKITKDKSKPELVFSGFSQYAMGTVEKLPEELERIFAPLPIESLELAPKVGRSEAHILGTTVMGHDPTDSIIDKDLIHHKYRNLLVLGGGAFPTISPSNPTLTICALSLRAAERLLG